MNKIGFIGAGKMGTALAMALLKADHKIQFWHDGNHTVSRPVKNHPELSVTSDEKAFLTLNEIFIIATDDSSITSVDSRLNWPKSSTVIHCSGALPSSILANAKSRGCNIGSLHAVTSLYSENETEQRFSSVPCVIEGDKDAILVMKGLVGSFANPVLEIKPEDKGIHHLACMFSVNFLSALLGRAKQLWTMTEIPEEHQQLLLLSLVDDYISHMRKDTLENITTGPIPRGDLGTLSDHIERFNTLPEEIGDDFRYYSLRTAELLRDKEKLSNSVFETIRRILGRQRTQEV